MSATETPSVRFAMPASAEAAGPPERRGIPREGVRLLVASPGGIAHRRFRDLPAVLAPGDVLVVNTSATLPAALDGAWEDGGHAVVHVADERDDGSWVVEIRRPDGRGPDLTVDAGTRVWLPGCVELRLLAPYPEVDAAESRLWSAVTDPAVDRIAYLATWGRPIAYGYRAEPVSLDELQNVYATVPGSAEMASAGRPFTEALLVRLMARGVVVAPVVLHAGVSSPEAHEPPAPERFAVPPGTARLVNAAVAEGRRVIAVGTTVVRALESATGPGGAVRPAEGWTDLVLGPDRPARVVGGLITGLHPPEASHLRLLEAVAGLGLVQSAYDEAVARRYLWHELGDSMLFLPPSPPALGATGE